MNIFKTTALTLTGAIAFATFMTFGQSASVHAQSAQPVPSQVKNFGPRLKKQQPQKGQQRRVANTKTIAEHGDWKITCEEARQTKDGKTVRPCGMVQTGVNEKRKNLALTLVLVKAEQNGKTATMMRVMAPIGVFLPTGVALEIDGAAVGRVPFTRCLPQVCVAFAEASPKTLEKLKKGGKAKFLIYEAPGLGISVDLSLKGFTAALNNLHQL